MIEIVFIVTTQQKYIFNPQLKFSNGFQPIVYSKTTKHFNGLKPVGYYSNKVVSKLV